MFDRVVTLRMNESQYKVLKEYCEENTTTIQLQLRKMLSDLEKKATENNNRSEG